MLSAIIFAIGIPLSVFFLIQGCKILFMDKDVYEDRRRQAKKEIRTELRDAEMLQEMGWIEPNWLGRRYISFLKYLSKDTKDEQRRRRERDLRAQGESAGQVEATDSSTEV